MRVPIFFATAAVVVLGVPQAARADEASAPASAVRADPLMTYRYVSPEPQRDFFRAVLEGIGVLSIGYVEYLISTHQAERGNRIGYDGAIFRDKLRGNARSFDENHFGTNFIGHPIGGTLYYLSARSNRLSVAQSFAWAFTGSLLWEYFGEIQEVPSYNDMIATPWGGFVNGETFTQLGSFFVRGRPTVHGRALAFLFGTPRIVHDWVDDATPEPAEATDALGFPTDVWHDFRATVGVGELRQSSVPDRPGSPASPPNRALVERVGIELAVANLPHLGRAGDASRLYDDGNVAQLNFDIAQAGGHVVDATYRTHISPLGYYVHHARVGEDGRLRGASGIFGLSFGFEYGTHDYDRDRRKPADAVAKVTVLGATGQAFIYRPWGTLRASLALEADFAGIRSYALVPYGRLHQAEDELPGVLRNEGYYFGVGPSIEPALALSAGPFSASASVHLDDFTGVIGGAVDQATITQDAPRSDRRVVGRGRVAFRPIPALELGLEVEGRRREGKVAEVTDTRTERLVTGSLSARF